MLPPTVRLNGPRPLVTLLTLLVILASLSDVTTQHRLRHVKVIGPGRNGWLVQPKASLRTRHPVAGHCYSCANYELRAYWYHLQMWYNTPHNFTDRCVTMDRRDCQLIALEPCQHQCVTLKQQKVIGGQAVGYHVIRGCLTSLFRWNVLERSDIAPVLSKPRDVCFSVKFSQLLPDNGKSLKELVDQTVHMCICQGDRCNGATRLNHALNLVRLIFAGFLLRFFQ